MNYLTGLFFGVFTSVAALLANLYQSFDTPNEPARWVYEGLMFKDNLVETRNPDLVIIAGSNALFGLSAKHLSDAYGIKAVNAALNAGLGLEYTLKYARKYLAPGRLFVLPLEYEFYAKPTIDDSLFYYVIGYDSAYLNGLNTLDRSAFLVSVPLRIHFQLFLERIVGKNSIETGYQSSTLNEFGDETLNLVRGGPFENVTKEAVLSKFLGSATRDIYSHDDRAWNLISMFAIDAVKVGAKVVLAHPSRLRQSLDLSLNSSFLAELNERARLSGITLISKVDDSLFDPKFMFDTHYHQNSIGQIASTDVLYQNLFNAGLIQTISKYLRSDKVLN